jgi:hypothetical protein
MDDRWKALWVLSAARVAMGFQFQSVGSTAPLLLGTLGLSLADVGWLVGIYLLPRVIGWFADAQGSVDWALHAAVGFSLLTGLLIVWTRWLTDRPAVARTDPSRS